MLLAACFQVRVQRMVPDAGRASCHPKAAHEAGDTRWAKPSPLHNDEGINCVVPRCGTGSPGSELVSQDIPSPQILKMQSEIHRTVEPGNSTLAVTAFFQTSAQPGKNKQKTISPIREYL